MADLIALAPVQMVDMWQVGTPMVGVPGPRGATGATGETGAQGAQGASIEAVSLDGTDLVVTLDDATVLPGVPLPGVQGLIDAATGAAATATAQAEHAATSAGEAATSAGTAGAQAAAAAGSASTASTQATNAADSATAAQTARTGAESAQTAAAASATAASGSASTASTKAGEASASATAAATSATNAATSASNAAATLAAAIPKSIADAKGDLLVGSANDTISRLAVGPNGALLVANSNAASGLEYQTPLPVLVNLLTNSDFSNGSTGWVVLDYCTLTASNSVLTMTGTGAASSALGYCSARIQRLGQKIYVRTSVRATSGSAVSLSIYGSGILAGVISAPILNQWYTPSGIITATTTGADLGFTFIASYADPASAAGQATEWKYPLLIDLTACFGAGNEPTKSEMDHLLTKYPNSWFKGAVNDLLRWGYDPLNRVGKGSPYNVVTPRQKGETWTDLDQTNGAYKWLATGTTAGSWIVVDGDTGVRALTMTAGYTGTLQVSRVGNGVTIRLDTIGSGGTSATTHTLATLPAGLRPAATMTWLVADGATLARVTLTSAGALSVVLASSGTLTSVSATLTLTSRETWFSTLPGTPA